MLQSGFPCLTISWITPPLPSTSVQWLLRWLPGNQTCSHCSQLLIAKKCLQYVTPSKTTNCHFYIVYERAKRRQLPGFQSLCYARLTNLLPALPSCTNMSGTDLFLMQLSASKLTKMSNFSFKIFLFFSFFKKLALVLHNFLNDSGRETEIG